MEKFQNLYTINKTLRFELKPIGETLENIKKVGFLERDKYKADNRRAMQEIIDKDFKSIIEDRISKLRLDENLLEDAFSTDVNRKENALKNLKEQIIDIFKDDEINEKYLKAGKHLKKLKKENPGNKIIKAYDKFSTYFVDFYNKREHILTADSSGSISFRIVEDNLKIFWNNLEKIKRLPEDLRNGLSELDKIDNLSYFNNYLSHSKIVKYNEIIGGVSFESGAKQQGINEKINEYSQKNKVKLPRLSPLYKMILSDRITSSFIPETIVDDSELIDMIFELVKNIDLNSKINIKNIDDIYIKYDKLGWLPEVNYSLINELLIKDYDRKNLPKNLTKKYEENRKKTIESTLYSLEKLSSILVNSGIDLIQNINDKYINLINNLNDSKKRLLEEDWPNITSIKQSGKTVIIKSVLDSLKELQKFYDMFDFVSEDNSPDPDFYLWLTRNSELFGFEFNSIYNKARNYLTKKQFSGEKYKLNFDSPTLAKGWGQSEEEKNTSLILRKFNKDKGEFDYYLGIWGKSASVNDRVIANDELGDFEKMQYMFLPNIHMMLPKLFLSEEWNELFPVSEEFLKMYNENRYKEGKLFNKDFLHELIERFKHGLINHEFKYQDKFNFNIKETKEYNEYAEFLKDVKDSNFKVIFNKVTGIEKLIKEGKLFLFQIWTKDFSKHSKGVKNLNTIYFESLFSEENIEKNIFKLSGKAEIFHRQASLNYDSNVLEKGHHYEELKDKFEYPIIKDKRYSEDKFMFHFTMQINFRSKNLNSNKLNKRINENISDFTHIIGIDRGERHLLYISVIEIATGKIVEERHLDEIINVDTKGNIHKTSYLQKLEERSKSRDNERKTWETIETIKELKDGYISQVVNEICNLQKKYNAIIVLENLNYGFKRARFKVEKQVYQKFEIALIKKFNYIIDKKDESTYLKGIQLTNPILKLDKIGSQSGIIFYIPAWNTSKIDPVTGFVNLLNSSDLAYSNKDNALEFIKKLEKIYFEDGVFKFNIDFAKWNNRMGKTKTKWILTSYGNRIETFRDAKNNSNWVSEEIDLTKEFEKILSKEDGTLINDDAASYKRFMQLFKLMLQIRNSKTGTNVDYLISPVGDSNGVHFDSREIGKSLPNGLPKDADANGAYNIARKGLMAINNILNNEKNPLKISNEDYLKYMQK